MNDDLGYGMSIGLVIGIVVMTLNWIFCADAVECAKTRDGYLTYKKDIYKVEKVVEYDDAINEIQHNLGRKEKD